MNKYAVTITVHVTCSDQLTEREIEKMAIDYVKGLTDDGTSENVNIAVWPVIE